MPKFRSPLWLIAALALPAALRADTASINVDYGDRVLDGSTGFGSNLDVNDNRHPEKHLDGERLLDRGFEWSANQVWSSTFIAGGAGSITRDTAQFYGGKASLKAVVTTVSASARVLVIVAGPWVQSGETYRFSFWAKGGAYTGRLGVSLIDGNSFGLLGSTLTFDLAGSSWTQHHGSLPVTVNASSALLLLEFFDTGTLWIDQMSLLPPAATPPGPPLDAALSDARLRFMRFPAGSEANAYNWKTAVGPRDQRAPNASVNAFYTDNAGLNLDRTPFYNDFGVDEFLQLCERKGWTPVLTVNVASGAAHAADWVEYCNGNTGTTWGAQRAANGHPAPYGVTYWEVGNELWNQYAPEPGAIFNRPFHTQANTNNYIAQLLLFSAALKAKDPTIRVGAVGGAKPADSILTNLVDPNWDNDLVAGAGASLDFVASHYYAPGGDGGAPSASAVYQSLLAAPNYFEQEMANLAALVPASVERTVTEYGVSLVSTATATDRALGQTWGAGLYLAGLNNAFLRQGVRFAAQHDLLNEYESMLEHTTDASGARVAVARAAELVLSLYGEGARGGRIAPATTAGTFSTPAVGWMSARANVPLLDAVASLNPDEKTLTLFAVNRSTAAVQSTTLRLAGFPGWLRAKGAATVTAASLDARNTAADPRAVYRRDLSSGEFRAHPPAADGSQSFAAAFPPASVTALQFTYAEPAAAGDGPRAFPTPYRPSAGGAMTLAPVPEGAAVTIYDLTGQRLRRLPVSAGRAQWDGLDENGRAAASGVYVVRIASPGGSWTKKVVLQR